MGFSLPGVAFAGMMPVNRWDIEPSRTQRGSTRTSPTLYVNAITDLDLGHAEWLPGVVEYADEQTTETQSIAFVPEGASSFALCIYGLMGFAVFRCAPWITRGFLGAIPAWYHDGGPYQIGHGYAVLPGSLACLHAFCFVQPECMVQEPSLQFDQGARRALLRKSDFTPEIIAPRGPPNIC